ncbi:hypothetical protein E2C01_046541 [Portunus trituberculatus]|uniref:Uncharacterized protein n=1 Tax=Portunus trituberculatus TaxID=210409 RepID=A0A5B7G5E2_PORTR|nr:hypothetical protein [Portunus trituberculatus]
MHSPFPFWQAEDEAGMAQKDRPLEDPQSYVTLKVGLEKKADLGLEVGYWKTELGVETKGYWKTELGEETNLKKKVRLVDKAEVTLKIGLGVKVV